MSPVFLDTAGLVAVVNADDQWHAAALDVWRDLVRSRRALVTTSLVLIELGDGLSKLQHHRLAVEMTTRLRHAPQVEIVPLLQDPEARAWDLFRQRPDKEWGVTDCYSFVVMQDRMVSEALTVDMHFEQAGFRKLIRS